MDTLYLKPGIHGIASSIPVSGALDVRTNATQQVSAVGRSSTVDRSSRFFSFKYPLKSLWPGPGGTDGNTTTSSSNNGYKGIAFDDAVMEVDNRQKATTTSYVDRETRNWVLRILHVTSLWRDQLQQEDVVQITHNDDHDKQKECDVCTVDDHHATPLEFDRDSFSKLLKRVSLAEAKLYAQMSYLGSLAYSIPNIKPGNLLKYRGLRFVTSSLEKRESTTKAEKTQVLSQRQDVERNSEDEAQVKGNKNKGYLETASVAYQIAASAACYLHSHTRTILPFKFSKTKGGEDVPEEGNPTDDRLNMLNSDVASFMATTDSVTAVVAAKEEVKQAVADDLKSTHSSPCEWFICDDDNIGTRLFVIQGSESLASWQANLLFEPIQFEGMDVLVHRGIYEAAKGIYEQMLPEVHAHLKAHGKRATFRFTGHSLGGSLSLLVNLMLLIRGEVPVSSLLPVITFGAPSIMCGGNHLLHELGLPRNHVQAITMHRDIVPRAFSCNYPNHIAELLKVVNGNFRNHPCLNNQKLLYAPMGELLILQPDEKYSPQHHLLPSGSGLYVLSCPLLGTSDAEKQLWNAQMVFLNSPHPLEILSDRAAYGSEGAIQRDHDMNSYLRSVRGVIRQELSSIRKARREHRRKFWWSLVLPRGVNAGIIIGGPVTSVILGMGVNQFNFTGIVQTGRVFEMVSRLVASQHMHLLVVLLFPARMLLLGAYNMISFR